MKTFRYRLTGNPRNIDDYMDKTKKNYQEPVDVFIKDESTSQSYSWLATYNAKYQVGLKADNLPKLILRSFKQRRDTLLPSPKSTVLASIRYAIETARYIQSTGLEVTVMKSPLDTAEEKLEDLVER